MISDPMGTAQPSSFHARTSWRHLDRVRGFSPAICMWLPTAFLALLVKWRLMHLQGFRFVSLHQDRIASDDLTNYVAGFSPLEILAFWRDDLLFGFVVIPLCLMVLTSPLRPGWRMAVTLLFSGLVAGLLCLQVYMLDNFGRFIPGDLIFEGLSAALHNPTLIKGYSSPWAVVVGGLASAVLLGMWLRCREIMWWCFRGHLGLILSPTVVALLAVATLLGIPRASSYHHSVYVSAVRGFWDGVVKDGDEQAAWEALSDVQILQKQAQMTGSVIGAPDPAYFGKAKGANLVIFFLETCPANCCDFDLTTQRLPNFRFLKQHAWTSSQHHTTYPNTSHSHYSILTSVYPPNNFWGISTALSGRNMISLLKHEGCQARIYGGPWAYNDVTGPMYDAFGLERITAQGQPGDREAMQAMTSDIRRWAEEGKRFVTVFSPQSGHAPWPIVPGPEPSFSLRNRRRNILGMEDEWMGQLLDTLRSTQQLENTLILVVGDHGVRNSIEDPSFRQGAIDEYTFRVPLLLFAPQVLDQHVALTQVTSHIDLMPTLLDLLGVERRREVEMGMPLWQAGHDQRVLFFFANRYLGADGLYDRGRYYMWNRLANLTYHSDRLSFGQVTGLIRDPEEHARVTNLILSVRTLKAEWTRRFCNDKEKP